MSPKAIDAKKVSSFRNFIRVSFFFATKASCLHEPDQTWAVKLLQNLSDISFGLVQDLCTVYIFNNWIELKFDILPCIQIQIHD